MRRALYLTSGILFVIALVITQPVQAEGWDHAARTVRVSILMYHHIDQPPVDANRTLRDLVVTPENFTAQMQWLKDQGYESITPEQLINALWYGVPLPPKPVMITFDDGYASAYYNAFPILRQFGYSGVFFVITDWVDENRPGYLTWDAARAMIQGGMFIENHSRSHTNMKNRSAEYLTDQIVGAQEAIEKNIGYRPRLFCYPFGGYDLKTVRLLHYSGLHAAFTTQHGYYAYSANMMRIPRLRVRGSMTIDDFARLIRRGG